MFDFLGCPHPLFSSCWPITLSLRVAPLGGIVSFLGRLLAWSTGGLSFPLAILLWVGALPLSLLFSCFRSPPYPGTLGR